MDFSFTPEQERIREAIERICAPFDADYWLRKDREGGFPEDFHRALAEAGWLGIAMPEAHGGAGLGITEAALMMETIAATGAGLSGASAVHMNIFGLHPVVVFGSEEQKRRWLPPLIAGRDKACFAVTEPNAGPEYAQAEDARGARRRSLRRRGPEDLDLDRAGREQGAAARAHDADRGGAGHAGTLALLHRSRPARSSRCARSRRWAARASTRTRCSSTACAIPGADRIGEEGKGFEYILHGMNPERILIAAEAVGLGRAALERAAAYANERIVFDRPIGQNQAIQHPLAKCWIELEAADLMVFKAASLYDLGKPCGAEANAAKYLAAEACFRACETAILTHGGMGYAKEYHVERYLREAWIPRLAPVSPQLILCFIAEKVLGLPKSY